MKIKEISYLDPIEDAENDCLDVRVTLENNDYYYVEVATPKFFYTLMKRFNRNFLPPYFPYIIVEKLTNKIIRDAIQEYIDADEDAYWLKLYHVAATLEIKDLNQILEQKKKRMLN